MNRLFNTIAALSVDHRWPTVCVIVLLSAAAAVGWLHPNVKELSLFEDAASQADSDEESSGEKKSGIIARAPQRRRSGRSLFDSDSIIVIDSDAFFTPEGAEALRGIVANLEELDYVTRVMWMDSVPILNIFGLAEPLLPDSSASERRFRAAREKALENPLVVGQLLSADAQTLLMLVTVDYDFVFSDDDVTVGLKNTVLEVLEEYPDLDMRVQVTGSAPAFIAAIGMHEANRTFFLSIGFGMVAVMAVVLFRGLQSVLIVSAAPIVGVAWTIGMIQYVPHSENNGLIDVILPVLVALVGITDGVHLMVQTRKLRAAGLSVRDAARKGLQQVGLACFLTSFTTAVGFGSLTLADHEFVQEFGRCAVMGVVMSFVAVVTIIPLLCSTRLGRNIHVGLENSLIDRNLGRVSGLIDVVLRYRRPLSITGIVLTVALVVLSVTSLEPDQRRGDNLPADSEAAIALDHLDDVLGGLETSHVVIHWSDRIPDDDPQILRITMAVDDLLRQEKLLHHPLSIRNLIDAQPGEGPPEERFSMIELLPPPIKNTFFDPDDNRTIVRFKVQDLGIARFGPVFERVEAGLADLEQQFPAFSFELEGSAAWRWRNLYQIVVDLAASLGTASVIIFGVLAFVFRSVRIGLISVVPNTFPLALAGAWLVVSGYNLEVVMVCCFTVCLGIAVDDSIHFLTRYQEELEVTPNIDQAIRRAFTGVGTALIMTTLVLVAGFSTVMFSGNRDYYIFAAMGTITISAALLADLIFLPPLLARFAPKTVEVGAFTGELSVSGEKPGDSAVESQPL